MSRKRYFAYFDPVGIAHCFKLVYYPGNLSVFVEKHPEAKSYYTLAATSVKFSFPSPGYLMGVRSNTRAILKLSDCTFTYPGKSIPSLHDVSCALSLSRLVPRRDYVLKVIQNTIAALALWDQMALGSQLW